MAKILFKAELRLPKQIILPLLVASAAASPRVLLVREREIEVADPIAQHLEDRHPGWLETKPVVKEPEQTKTPATDDKSDAASQTSANQVEDQPPVDPAASASDAASPDEGAPLDDVKLKKLTIAQLETYAAEWGIDLGEAKKHDDIVDVIIKALADEDGAADSSADGS
ncbi:MAG: hypothetical protein ABI690_13525 [Chloroflexota bacterium]